MERPERPPKDDFEVVGRPGIDSLSESQEQDIIRCEFFCVVQLNVVCSGRMQSRFLFSSSALKS